MSLYRTNALRRRHLYNETVPVERLWFTWLWAAGLSFRSIARWFRRSPSTVRRDPDRRCVLLKKILLKTADTSSWIFLVLFLALAEAECVSLREALQPTHFWNDVVLRVSEIAERYLAGCHLVMAGPRFSPSLVSILWKNSGAGIAASLVEMYVHRDMTKDNKWGREVGPTLDQGIWRKDEKATCRGLLLDHTAGDIIASEMMMSRLGLWQHPEIRVVIIGCKKDVKVLLMQRFLRNTRHAIYITASTNSSQSRGTFETRKSDVHIYTRCLYCDAGKPKVLMIQNCESTGVTQDLEMFTEKKEAFLGHTFKMVAMQYFPFASFERLNDKPGTLMVPKDSLNARMITAISSGSNFTYEIREPEDRQWGLQISPGNWTGVIGTLQHEKADFSIDITPTLERADVVEFSTLYIEEPVVIISHKPKPLPEYLSLVRPLEGDVWMGIVMGAIIWGASLWFIQRLRLLYSEGHRLNFASSMFYGWGLLLEDNPYEPPSDSPGQILVGTWLLLVFIVSAAYRSSFISHLVVQGKSAVINSMEDLVERGEADGWEWGTKRMTGALKHFLSSSSNPAILKVYRGMQTADIEEGMKRVVDGGFSYIHNYYFLKTLIDTRFTDQAGYTPIHISNIQYPLFVGGNGWAFRRGAPFQRRFNEEIQNLLDAGLVKYWMDDVIWKYVSNERRASLEGTRQGWKGELTSNDDGLVVLELSHMQGTIYALLLGHVAATITLFIEHLYRINHH